MKKKKEKTMYELMSPKGKQRIDLLLALCEVVNAYLNSGMSYLNIDDSLEELRKVYQIEFTEKILKENGFKAVMIKKKE